jgi:hypothetical protein
MSRGGGGSGGENPGKDVRRWRRVPQAVLSDGGRSGHERERERASVMCGRAGLVAGVQLWGVSPLTSIGPPLVDRN